MGPACSTRERTGTPALDVFGQLHRIFLKAQKQRPTEKMMRVDLQAPIKGINFDLDSDCPRDFTVATRVER